MRRADGHGSGRRGAGARGAALAAAVGCCLALSSCSSASGGGAPPHAARCAPEVVRVSPVVARPGDQVVLSAPAAPCRVRFTGDGVLTLSMRPVRGGGDGAVALTTATAAPSGAYRTTARVPEGAAPGGWSVEVADGLAATPCDDTGSAPASCAAPEAYLQVVPAGEDWSTGGARRRADAVVARIRRDLAGFPGFLSARVLPGGVQLSLGPPYRDRVDRVIAAAGGDQPVSIGTPVAADRVPVVRLNGRIGRAELSSLERRVTEARTALRRRGIDVATVALDLDAGVVAVRLQDGADADARELARRFGPGLDVRPAR